MVTGPVKSISPAHICIWTGTLVSIKSWIVTEVYVPRLYWCSRWSLQYKSWKKQVRRPVQHHYRCSSKENLKYKDSELWAFVKDSWRVLNWVRGRQSRAWHVARDLQVEDHQRWVSWSDWALQKGWPGRCLGRVRRGQVALCFGNAFWGDVRSFFGFVWRRWQLVWKVSKGFEDWISLDSSTSYGW